MLEGKLNQKILQLTAASYGVEFDPSLHESKKRECDEGEDGEPLEEAGFRKVRSFVKPGAPKKKKLKKGTSGERAKWRQQYRKNKSKKKLQRKRAMRKPEVRRRMKRKAAFLKRMGESQDVVPEQIRRLFVSDMVETLDYMTLVSEAFIDLANDIELAEAMGDFGCRCQEMAYQIETEDDVSDDMVGNIRDAVGLISNVIGAYESADEDGASDSDDWDDDDGDDWDDDDDYDDDDDDEEWDESESYSY